jgi:hypothetical protein
MSTETGELLTICHGDVEVRFTQPIPYTVRPGLTDGSYACILLEPRLATRIRERVNHGRGTTPAGARKSLERRLLKLVLSAHCPRLLASLVEYVGPRQHDSRAPVTEMLKLALLAQWLCVEGRSCRVYSEVSIRQEPCYAPVAHMPQWRLDLMMLEASDGLRPPRVTGVEIKSSRADFSGDKKWRGYIGRVDRLYIATLPGVVREGELPEGVGLLTLRREAGSDGFFERVRPAEDADVNELARYDLLYALACSDRLRAGGLELQQRAQHLVDAHWAGAKPRRRAAAAL